MWKLQDVWLYLVSYVLSPAFTKHICLLFPLHCDCLKRLNLRCKFLNISENRIKGKYMKLAGCAITNNK